MKILYFSTVNWKWIKQRPHFIAHYLSEKGHDVDYLSLNPVGKTSVQKWSMERLNIIDSYVLPFSLKFRWIEKMNISYIQTKLFDKKYDIIILNSPLHHQYIPASIKSESTLVYECMDNMPYFYEGLLRERMLSEEQKTIVIADAVITSSDKLRVKLQRRYPDKQLAIQTIYNALDKETFGRRPKKIALKEPNLLYIGTISHWLDWDTLNQFAKNHPKYTIYLIGPYEMKKKFPPNIVWLGVVPHNEVMDYIYSGNVMLIPFKVNELIEAVDPVKLYEYLYMDKTIISAYWVELDRFKCDNLKFYRNYHDFEAYALQSYSEIDSTLNQAFIERNNWNSRITEYIRFIDTVHSKKIQNT